MRRHITVDREVINESVSFARRFLRSDKSGKDFGNRAMERVAVDRIADVSLGKIGEYAFSAFLGQFGVDVRVDTSLYTGQHAIDFGQDVPWVVRDGAESLLVPRVDVKTSKSNSRWLLVEEHKMWASIVVFMTVDIEKDIESNLDRFDSADLDCAFVGYALWRDLYDAEQQPWFVYRSGDRLLRLEFVECMMEELRVRGIATEKKSDLAKCFDICSDRWQQEGKEPRFGPPLKCPKQYGLPVTALRRSDEDVDRLVRLIAESVFPGDKVKPLRLEKRVAYR